ncbi:MAG: hypothetical protein HFE73_05405 [Firmicutes bacterium]|nr:hypothetical protein [Bacillota bacterium]
MKKLEMKWRNVRKLIIGCGLLFLLLFLGSCSDQNRNKEDMITIMEGQMKAELQQGNLLHEWKDYIYDETQSLLHIESVTPSHFIGFKEDAFFVQFKLEPYHDYNKDGFIIGAIFSAENRADRTNIKLVTAGVTLLGPHDSAVLEVLPRKNGADCILFLKETTYLGFNTNQVELWKWEKGGWESTELPELPTTSEKKNVTIELSKKNDLLVISEEIEGAATKTGKCEMQRYYWDQTDGKFLCVES